MPIEATTTGRQLGAFEPIASSPDWSHGRAGPLVVTLWRGRTELPYVRQVRATIERTLAERTGSIAVLTVIDPAAEPPPAPVREAIAAILKVGADRVAGSALVHEGDGFRAAAVRSIVTGLALIVRQPYPHKVFGEVTLAAAWLSLRIGAAVMSAAAIEAGVTQCRAAR